MTLMRNGPNKVSAADQPNGNCGRCGTPIRFMNVMLCDSCLENRLGKPAALATASPHPAFYGLLAACTPWFRAREGRQS